MCIRDRYIYFTLYVLQDGNEILKENLIALSEASMVPDYTMCQILTIIGLLVGSNPADNVLVPPKVRFKVELQIFKFPI